MKSSVVRSIPAAACALSALGLIACSGSQKPVDEGPSEVDLEAACDAGDMASCVELAHGACTGTAWQVEFDRSPALFASSSGLARLDRLNMMLLSTNSAEWLACIEECPGTGAEKVCIPFVLDRGVALEERDGCEVSEREVRPWNGRDATTRLRDCPGQLAEITYVPELADAQRAMVASNSVEKGGPLDIGGMVVKLTVDGAPVLTVARVSEADCSVFDIPPGYRIVRGADAFQEARAMQPELQKKFDAAQAELRRQLEAALRAARSRVEPDVRELCADNGYDVDNQESLTTCTFEVEGARALITKAVSEELERARIQAEPKVDQALRDHVIEPLCRTFGDRIPAATR